MLCHVRRDWYALCPVKYSDVTNVHTSVAGTLRYAELKPDLPPSIFSTLPLSERQDQRPPRLLPANKDVNATSPSTVQGDEGLYGDGIADEDMFEAGMSAITSAMVSLANGLC